MTINFKSLARILRTASYLLLVMLAWICIPAVESSRLYLIFLTGMCLIVALFAIAEKLDSN